MGKMMQPEAKTFLASCILHYANYSGVMSAQLWRLIIVRYVFTWVTFQVTELIKKNCDLSIDLKINKTDIWSILLILP